MRQRVPAEPLTCRRAIVRWERTMFLPATEARGALSAHATDGEREAGREQRRRQWPIAVATATAPS